MIRKDYPTTGVLKLSSLSGGARRLLPHQEGLPDYWGIETWPETARSDARTSLSGRITRLLGYWNLTISTWSGSSGSSIRKDYPTTGVLKLTFPCLWRIVSVNRWSGRITRLLGYWNWFVAPIRQGVDRQDQEGLPDYWGIETGDLQSCLSLGKLQIRKDYPTTGVLKLYGGSKKTAILSRHQEGLPDYWGIETLCKMPFTILRRPAHQEGLPDYWGIETISLHRFWCAGRTAHQEGLPDYWGIETVCDCALKKGIGKNQEGLPDYWGIETDKNAHSWRLTFQGIRKDYPTTGVLKPENMSSWTPAAARSIRKDYPTTGVLKPWLVIGVDCEGVKIIRKDYPTTGVLKLFREGCKSQSFCDDQEGLPDYWGIETIFRTLS